ncbi:conserved hypothetical protein [Beutenbergia cavernae DSM 12333]|uniref:Uncharacterized protein n=1 Tax=Beutenbergia cavernae (strain ATCC BAA-8 / DSM 12333 / CCUG 43141 / JCM 11478 / NBRC 16432 / NCIMB 13614 / HKI 0122) TaxID=471853 RepID=C5C470_BEUC1|nr:hypothetical protein [Beutenbergia cavernae]ACQ79983.1 conserved hypothetical protein [Beutenbergia cavernae DSM 12333]
MENPQAPEPATRALRTVPRGAWIAGGAICGLAWSAALRGYMVELAGTESTFTWGGTFGALLLPGALAGGLLGWAEHLRRTGGRPRWRALALAPLPLAVAPLLMPGALATLATTGEGGGALAVGLMGPVGGYALAGRGPLRVISQAAAGAFVIALGATAPVITRTPLSDPRSAWNAVLVTALYGVLALGCAIPFRGVVAPEPARDGAAPDRGRTTAVSP